MKKAIIVLGILAMTSCSDNMSVTDVCECKRIEYQTKTIYRNINGLPVSDRVRTGSITSTTLIPCTEEVEYLTYEIKCY